MSFVVMAVACFALDQAAKGGIEHALVPGERRAFVWGFFEVVHVRNPGAAFGLLAELAPELRIAVFASIFVFACFVILSILRSLAPRDAGSALALGSVLGGAASNLADRLLASRDGEVIDYLHVRLWGGYPWPDFNLADAFIVLGVMGLAAQLSAAEGEARAATPSDSAKAGAPSVAGSSRDPAGPSPDGKRT